MPMALRRWAMLVAAALLAGGAGSGCPADLGRCGDGHLDPGEECDDGNEVGGDTCSASCRRDGTDEDDDGFPTPQDCNDRLASVHPGAPELPCDGVDNDCSAETPDCPGDDGGNPGPDAGRDASADPPDAQAPEPDACVARAETCADCLDQDCDGQDDACDGAARIAVAPAAPSAGQDATVVVSTATAYTWVLLAHDAPDNTRAWLGCQNCTGTDGERFTWTYTLPNLTQGRHLIVFGRDYENDDPAVGTPVICATIDVAN